MTANDYLETMEDQVARTGIYLPPTFKDDMVQHVRNHFLPWNRTHAQRFGSILKHVKRLQSYTIQQEKSFDVLLQDMLASDLGIFKKMHVSPKIHVQQIASGNWFTLFLMQDQCIFGFGKSHYGELGLASESFVAHVLSDVPPASYIAAGHSAAYAIANNGKLFAWGCKADGRLGVTKDATALAYAENGRIFESESPVRFQKISAGSTHAAATSRDQYLYSWGMGQYNGFNRIKYLPKKLMKGKCLDVVCGVSGYHSVCLMADGTVWGWGHNSMFALGLPKRKIYVKPHRLPFPPCEVDQVAAGWAHTVVHLKKGGFLCVGRNGVGQCNRPILDSTVLDSMEDMGKAMAVVATFSPILDVPLHGRIVCGSSSTAIVTEEGSWTFGSNTGHLFRECSKVFDHHAVFCRSKVLAMGYMVGYAKK
tara:strand:+ start:3382 stop:4647 length:1266 start_codon:yes stop_codon:yes gene_type:complete